MEENYKKGGGNRIQLILGSILTLLLYIYLTIRAYPEFGILKFFKGLAKIFLLLWSGVPIYVWMTVVDLFFVVLLGAVIWLSFFAQFVLPVSRWTERIKAAQRLFVYPLVFIRRRGPALLVINGKVQQRDPEHVQRRGTGALLLDSTSAALLRNDISFTRTIGPGLTFTRPGEYLARALDTRRQVWPDPEKPLGPLEGEDPFAEKKKDETDEVYKARQGRRLETSGLTRDGVEVIPNIFVAFQLERESHSDVDATGYDFDPGAIQRAATAESVELSPGESAGRNRKVPWRDLPAQLAVDLWREYLRKFMFADLFKPVTIDGIQDQIGIEVIRYLVRARMTRQKVLSMDAEGQTILASQAEGQHEWKYDISREFELLQNSGIQVLHVPIRNLRFPPGLEKQMEDRWFNYWLAQAKKDREQVENRRQQSIRIGELEGNLDFASSAIRKFDGQAERTVEGIGVQNQQDRMRQAARLLLLGTLIECRAEDVRRKLAGEEKLLLDAIGWLGRSDGGKNAAR
jgi:hypothetical protein